jgi:hypothetical protein
MGEEDEHALPHSRMMEGRGGHTRLQPSTSIWVSSMVHFLRAFFSGGGLARRRTLPRRSSEGEGRLVSSRNLKAGTSRSEAGVARETRRCFGAEEEVKGAVKEKVEECVVTAVAIVRWDVVEEEREEGFMSREKETRVGLTSLQLVTVQLLSCLVASLQSPHRLHTTHCDPSTHSPIDSPGKARHITHYTCLQFHSVAHYDETSNSGAIRSATPSNFFFQASSLSASLPICPRDSTRGCTHVTTAFWSTWSIEPRISFKLNPS